MTKVQIAIAFVLCFLMPLTASASRFKINPFTGQFDYAAPYDGTTLGNTETYAEFNSGLFTGYVTVTGNLSVTSTIMSESNI